MKGALPPSSRLIFFTVPAHCSINNLPISVEPVNDSLRTIGLEVSSAPCSPAEPVMTLNTPTGTPARSANSASAVAEKAGDPPSSPPKIPPSTRVLVACIIRDMSSLLPGAKRCDGPT